MIKLDLAGSGKSACYNSKYYYSTTYLLYK